MDKLTISGEVKKIGEIFKTDTFKKRELVIETGGDYPQVFGIEFVNAKEELLDIISVGQQVTVHVNLRGREWISPQGDAKYFTSLNAWKIEVTS